MKRNFILLICAINLLISAYAFADTQKYAEEVEKFRLEYTDKILEYTKNINIYIDTDQLEAADGAQLFLVMMRQNIYLANNILDLTFLYKLNKHHDEKGLVREFVSSRLGEIAQNLSFNAEYVDSLIQVLVNNKQLTLAHDYGKFRDDLYKLKNDMDSLRDLLTPLKTHSKQ